MNVLLPRVEKDNSIVLWKPMKSNEHLIPQFHLGHTKDLLWLINKQPIWLQTQNTYYLKFDKRVAVPSVKNFQLVNPLDRNLPLLRVAERIFLQFGRVGNNSFNLDFSWPFSILQAFAIALASFDYK